MLWCICQVYVFMNLWNLSHLFFDSVTDIPVVKNIMFNWSLIIPALLKQLNENMLKGYWTSELDS